jgi:hypothetical protein
MTSHHPARLPQPENWVAFPGGELEGRRPKVMCRACRDRASRSGTLCFQCYRAELDRERALKRAGELDTASEARFQCSLPFEPVNHARLERLRIERTQARRAWLQTASGAFAERQRRAQIAARHAVQLAASESMSAASSVNPVNPVNLVNPVKFDMAVHAAELQLPEAWLPFVVSR